MIKMQTIDTFFPIYGTREIYRLFFTISLQRINVGQKVNGLKTCDFVLITRI